LKYTLSVLTHSDSGSSRLSLPGPSQDARILLKIRMQARAMASKTALAAGVAPRKLGLYFSGSLLVRYALQHVMSSLISSFVASCLVGISRSRRSRLAIG